VVEGAGFFRCGIETPCIYRARGEYADLEAIDTAQARNGRIQIAKIFVAVVSDQARIRIFFFLRSCVYRKVRMKNLEMYNTSLRELTLTRAEDETSRQRVGSKIQTLNKVGHSSMNFALVVSLSVARDRNRNGEVQRSFQEANATLIQCALH